MKDIGINIIFTNEKQKDQYSDKIDEARSAAVDLVFSVLENNSYTNLSFDQAFCGKILSNLDRSFATAISYGTITYIVVIDAILSKYSKLPINKIESKVRTILRISIWQIFWSDSIPDFAICNESVKLTKKYSNKGAVAFVNGLLRTLIRDKETVMNDFIIAPRELWLRLALPRELAGYFKKWFGETRAISICDSMNLPSHSTARVNSMKTTDDLLRNELEMNGCLISNSYFMDHAFSIKTNGVMMENLPSFQNGEFVIQDEAAMLVSIIANPSPGDHVVDLCSAPGGKTCHMAEIMGNQGEITAYDVNTSRLSLVMQNADKLGLSIINCLQMDACDLADSKLPNAPANIVLADVPCSGLGILGKKPDIRIHMTHEKMIALYPVQKQILENAATLVTTGGYLVYSTCTINPAENQNRIEDFLNTHSDEFEAVDITKWLPEKLTLKDPLIIESAKCGMITLYPDKHKCDGFFIAKLRRKIKVNQS